MGWKLEESITTSGGKRGQEGDDKVVQFVSEIGGGDCPWPLRTGTGEAELPARRLHTKCKNIPLPWLWLRWGTRSLLQKKDAGGVSSTGPFAHRTSEH